MPVIFNNKNLVEEARRNAPLSITSSTVKNQGSSQEFAQENFIRKYFKLVGNHNFNTAYEYLSPSWNITLSEYIKYWSQYDKDSLEVNEIRLENESNSMYKVNFLLSGNKDGKAFRERLSCKLQSINDTFYIEACN